MQGAIKVFSQGRQGRGESHELQLSGRGKWSLTQSHPVLGEPWRLGCDAHLALGVGTQERLGGLDEWVASVQQVCDGAGMDPDR